MVAQPALTAPLTSPGEGSSGPPWLAIASCLFTAWVLGLIVLVVATANPPQLNWVQLSRARVLVAARVADVASGHCEVLRRFTPGQVGDSIRVLELQETGARNGQAYLLPLTGNLQGDDEYRVVTVPERDIGPLIYPADPALEARLESWQRAAP